jgi:hypothetical protein
VARGNKTGGGSRCGIRNKRTVEVEAWARNLLEDPQYQEKFHQRLVSGALPPQLESMVYGYAYGRPVERKEHTGADGAPLVILYGRADKDSLV